MRKSGVLFGFFFFFLVILLGVFFVPKMRENARDDKFQQEKQARDYDRTVALIKHSKPEAALEIIHSYKGEIESLSAGGIRWLELFIKVSEVTKDIPQLVVLFEYYPEIFEQHENAAFLVADSYILSNQVKDYKKVRALWQGRETKISSWFDLDVDQFLLEGHREEAIDFLESHSFEDKEDIGRLVRLALLYANEELKTAWKYLGEAYAKDPKNPDIHSYRAKILESVGKNTMAHKEYQAAALLDPNNIFSQDQLADFYLRQKQYPSALQIWTDHLIPPSLDKVWVKALFWSRATEPVEEDWDSIPIPQGRLKPLIKYMVQLEPGEFWNQEKFEDVINGKHFLKAEQATLWLRVLDALRLGNEKEALRLLQYNPFMTISWNPELELALQRILTYRKTGSLQLEESFSGTGDNHRELYPFFQQLEEIASKTTSQVPEELHNLLTSKEVFSAVFIAAGWFEAGLQLHVLPVIPKEFPDWVPTTILETLYKYRSSQEAYEFVELQEPSPDLSLLAAELMISGGDTDTALEKLSNLSALDSDIGYRSAWLASLLYIKKEDFDNARDSVQSQPRLAEDLLGQETLARIAHLEGDNDLAERLYTSLEEKSSEARSYLARKAFQEDNWKRARELTEQLLQDYPDNAMLKENLRKILEEESKFN
ncbi:MAG: hypothetical protein K940chlam7_00880 [Chlamydiae bacterium]|nr:hypothetical protein [Chlamydiota bacterium]